MGTGSESPQSRQARGRAASSGGLQSRLQGLLVSTKGAGSAISVAGHLARRKPPVPFWDGRRGLLKLRD